jgi:hypothetical protein
MAKAKAAGVLELEAAPPPDTGQVIAFASLRSSQAERCGRPRRTNCGSPAAVARAPLTLSPSPEWSAHGVTACPVAGGLDEVSAAVHGAPAPAAGLRLVDEQQRAVGMLAFLDPRCLRPPK